MILETKENEPTDVSTDGWFFHLFGLLFPSTHVRFSQATFEAQNFDLPHGLFQQNPILNSPLPEFLPTCTPTTAGTAAAPTAVPNISFAAMMEGARSQKLFYMYRSSL